MPSSLPELAAYLGTSYYIDLRKPKTRDEFKTLLNQLEALGSQFDEIAHLLRRLRPPNWPDDHDESRKIGSVKRIWNMGHESVFYNIIIKCLFGVVSSVLPQLQANCNKWGLI